MGKTSKWPRVSELVMQKMDKRTRGEKALHESIERPAWQLPWEVHGFFLWLWQITLTKATKGDRLYLAHSFGYSPSWKGSREKSRHSGSGSTYLLQFKQPWIPSQGVVPPILSSIPT